MNRQAFEEDFRMTMIPIWVVSTCIPSQSEPCLPNLFATETEALIHLDKMMREEWDSDTPKDEEGNRLAYPGDWRDAQDALKEYLGEEWGTWELSSHTIDVPVPTSEAPPKVVIEVSGGVAECTSQPPSVDVEIIDHDNAEPPVNEIEADERSASARDAGAEKYLAAPRSLDDLLQLMHDRDDARWIAAGLPMINGERDWTSLPTFGGDEPSNTLGIWSWDADWLIIGSCPQDSQIVDRMFACSWIEQTRAEAARFLGLTVVGQPMEEPE